MMLKKSAIAGVMVAAALLVPTGVANAIELPTPPAIPAPGILPAVPGDDAAATEETTTEETATEEAGAEEEATEEEGTGAEATETPEEEAPEETPGEEAPEEEAPAEETPAAPSGPAGLLGGLVQSLLSGFGLF